MNSSLSSNSLNKEQFNKCIHLVALKIPAKQCSLFLNEYEEYVFKRPKMKRIHQIEGDTEHRLLLLNETVGSIDSLPQSLVDLNTQHDATAETYDLNITYDQLGVDEVLRALLPNTIVEIPSAFEQAGHLAHVNLREDALPYKHLIGQVLLDKNPCIKTVVNKTGNIETEFRTFPMELLAGENNYNVLLKESGATFNFNFKDVYWNSRLQMEHFRIINWISGVDTGSTGNTITTANKTNKLKQKEAAKKSKQTISTDSSNTTSQNGKENAVVTKVSKKVVVADMMAGVGPFAVPLSMGNRVGVNDVKVYANDLNPSSYKYLVLNGRTNHCEERLESYNMDGRDFILHLLEQNICFNEVIMNLPQNATDFLDVFIGMATRLGTERYTQYWSTAPLPRIHVYAFSTAIEDPVQDIVNRSAGILQCDPTLLRYVNTTKTVTTEGIDAVDNTTTKVEKEDVCSDDKDNDSMAVGHVVRDVSPKKVMVCLSFRLPREVAFATPTVMPSNSINSSSANSKKRSAEDAGIDSDK